MAGRSREALGVFHELEWLGFSQQHFDEIAPVPMHIGSYVSSLDSGRSATHEMAITMRRMTEEERLEYTKPPWADDDDDVDAEAAGAEPVTIAIEAD